MTQNNNKSENKNGFYVLSMAALAALYFLVPLLYSPASNDIFKLPKNVFFQILSLLSLLFFLCSPAARKQESFLFRKPVVWLAGFFILSVFLHPHRIFLRDALFFLCAYGLILVLAGTGKRGLLLLCKAAFLSSFFAAATGILQHFGHDITGISTLTGVQPSFMASTLGHRNYLAEFLCMTIPFGFAFYLTAREKPFACSCYFAALCVMFIALMLTNSRGGWLAFGSSALFFCPS